MGLDSYFIHPDWMKKVNTGSLMNSIGLMSISLAACFRVTATMVRFAEECTMDSSRP